MARFSDYAELAKPRVTLLNLVVAAGGYWFAAEPGSLERFFWTLLGTALVVGSANALNCYLERDRDRFMERTRDRPLPAGRMVPGEAFGFGALLGVVGLTLLAVFVNPLTAALGALALVSYVGVYTPLKARSSLALVVGAIPGAAPALMGATGSTGRIEATGVLLFLLLFLWQIPHFIAISLYRAKEYAAAGLQVMPNEFGERAARRELVRFELGVVAASLAMVLAGVVHSFYLVIAAALGIGMLLLALYGLWTRDVAGWARRFFLGTNLYLTLLFGALALDKWILG